MQGTAVRLPVEDSSREARGRQQAAGRPRLPGPLAWQALAGEGRCAGLMAGAGVFAALVGKMAPPEAARGEIVDGGREPGLLAMVSDARLVALAGRGEVIPAHDAPTGREPRVAGEAGKGLSPAIAQPGSPEGAGKACGKVELPASAGGGVESVFLVTRVTPAPDSGEAEGRIPLAVRGPETGGSASLAREMPLVKVEGDPEPGNLKALLGSPGAPVPHAGGKAEGDPPWFPVTRHLAGDPTGTPFTDPAVGEGEGRQGAEKETTRPEFRGPGPGKVLKLARGERFAGPGMATADGDDRRVEGTASSSPIARGPFSAEAEQPFAGSGKVVGDPVPGEVIHPGATRGKEVRIGGEAGSPHGITAAQAPREPGQAITLQNAAGSTVLDYYGWERLLENLAGSLRGIREGEVYRARLRLHPPQLGSLELEAEWSGSLRVSLEARSLQAFQALREGLDQLRQFLVSQGLPLQDLRLSLKAGDSRREERGEGGPVPTSAREQEREPVPARVGYRWRLGTLDLLV